MNAKEKIIESILKKAKLLSKKPKIVLCEGWNERGLKATEFILKENIAEMILLGNIEKIKAEAAKFKVDISSVTLIDPETSEIADELAEALAKKREHKGLTLNKAKELIKDVNYFGCMMALTDNADGVVGSLICPTAELMKPVLQLLRKDHVNEVIILNDVKNDRVLFGTDASLNVDPTEEQLAIMGVNAANVAKVFGFEPKVGYLSFSTKGSGGDGPEVLKIRNAITKLKEIDSEIAVDGEFQFDAAVNPKAAERKCPDSEIGGKVNTLIFPNLTASNIFVHGLGQFSDMDFLFTIIAGLKKPVSILGRTTDQETVTNMFVVTALQTQ